MSTSSEHDSDNDNLNETTSTSSSTNDNGSDTESSDDGFDSEYINDIFQEGDPDAVDVNEVNNTGNNMAMVAIKEENLLTKHDLNLLIKKGLKLDQINAEGQTLLMLVAQYDQDPSVSKLIPIILEGGNSDQVDENGDNALIYALRNTSYNISIVKSLIKLAGDDILFRILDILEQEGGDEESIEFLSDAISVAIGNGASPFGKKNNRTLFYDLAKISANTSEDVIPIFDALAKPAKAKSPSDLAALLDELNPSYVEGEAPITTLTVPVRVGDVNFVEVLLKSGANPSKVEYTESETNPEILDLLRKYKESYGKKVVALAPPPKKGKVVASKPEANVPLPAERARGSTPPCDKSGTCPAILKSGERKGQACGKPGVHGGFCGTHKPK